MNKQSKPAVRPGIHNPSRHILDKKALAWSTHGELSSSHCFALCALLAIGNSFTTSGGCLWGNVYWASSKCGHETSPQSLEQARLSVHNLGVGFAGKSLYLPGVLQHVGERAKKESLIRLLEHHCFSFRIYLNPDLSPTDNLHLLSDHPLQTQG